MYGCESWTIKKAEYWRIDVFELWCWRKTPESPLDSNEIKPFNSKGNQPWIFILRTDAEAEAPILWPLMQRTDSLEKTLMLWKTKAGGEGDHRRQDGWMTSLTQWNEFEQVLGVGDGQGSLVCCSAWGSKELDATEQLNWTELNWIPSLVEKDLYVVY